MTQLVIFDLDGTLLDTVADLAHGTNYALARTGFAPHPIESYKFFVGNGINKLFERALPDGAKTQENVMKVREAFLPYYDEHNTDYTSPYEGMAELLHSIQALGIQMAVASNKYQRATKKLIDRFFPEIRFTAVFGQREGFPTKPDPSVVKEILNLAHVTPEESLYVGDSAVDMQTAANSGIESIGVTWGFRPRTELEEAKACHIVESTMDILNFIQTKITSTNE